MNHPIDLLVDLVDGSISERDQAVVEAHLASCGRCRQEIALATAGREALRSLPAPAVPPGIGDAAIREAEERARDVAPEVTPLRRGAPAWYRWAGAAAAAAAVILVVVVTLPNVGDDDQAPTLEAAEDAPGSAPLTATALEEQAVDYDTASVQALALSFTGDRTASDPGFASSAGASAPMETAGGFDEALACLRQAQPALEDQEPARLIAASYDGRPAYLGAFLAGPGADQPADTVTVWVVDRRTCGRILNTTTASL